MFTWASPRAARRRRPAPASAQARGDAVERQIDHRRREQRQHLAHQQAADDADAERMAQFRARAGAEHQGQGAEDGGHRRHQNGAKAQQAGLVDRLARRAAPRSRCATIAKSIIRMAFFFTMPISRMMPISAMMVRSSPASMRASSAPMPADGSVERIVIGMDEALVQHAEHDVHRRARRPPAATARWSGCCGRRAPRPERWCGCCPASRCRCSAFSMAETAAPSEAPGRKIERYRGRRKLRQMIDEQRPRLHIDLGDRRQRHLAAGGRRHVDGGQRIDGPVRRRIRLENDAILIRLSENRGDDSLAESIVQRVVDRADADAETRRAVAVDGDVGRKPVVFLIADDVRELGLLAQRRQQLRRPGRTRPRRPRFPA